ncbi:MAG: hypothetical protein HKN09_06985 [Saprospiraceae bacterium]|nr:hypothetical protein [Saprospiraceae bacterium]
MRSLTYVFLGLILCASVYFGYEVYQNSIKENKLKYDYAEINEIKYGLFNIDAWKSKIYDLVESKIDDFEISDDSYDVIREQMVLYLEDLHQEYFVEGKLIESFMTDKGDDKNNVGKVLLNMFKGGIEKQLKEIDFKSRIPALADQLILELKKRSPEIKGAISKEISELLIDQTARNLGDRRQAYFEKYGQDNFVDTNSEILKQINEVQEARKTPMQYAIGLLLFALLILLFGYKFLPFRPSMVILNFVSIIALAMGLALPMIELDARLNAVDITLLDAQIHFDEQVLFYQSKSILQVTETLIKNHAVDVKIVGYLILLFSIILPFSKMVLSLLALFMKKVRTLSITKTIIFYMGKWSMADVFVVAIFMSYIGMYGLLNSQIVDAGATANLNTVNYSSLSPGIIFFTAYCILSIIMSSLIHRHFKQKDL